VSEQSAKDKLKALETYLRARINHRTERIHNPSNFYLGRHRAVAHRAGFSVRIERFADDQYIIDTFRS